MLAHDRPMAYNFVRFQLVRYFVLAVMIIKF